MDSGRFDALTRLLAAPRSRRGFLAGTVALVVSARSGIRGSAQDGCPPGQTRNRKGDCTCPPGTDACSTGCYNLRSDLSNCGSCGNVCPTGAVCVKGECRCPSGTVACGGACRTQASFADDPNNCGACGNRCPSGSDPATCEGPGACFAGTCGFDPRPAGELCRPAADLCDAPEHCDGVSTACPADTLKAAGVQCRSPQGNCDEPEFCTGSSPVCPTDTFSPASTKCVTKTGPCNQDVFCTGTSPICPSAGQIPDGQQGTCPDGFACTGGFCRQTCDTPADCLVDDECQLAVCIGGFCGTSPQVDGGQCGQGKICRGGQCVGNGVCDGAGFTGICPFTQPTGCNNFCGCILTAENAPVCAQNTEFDCQGNQPCQSSPDCPPGFFCRSGPCSGCDTKVCAPLCVS